MFATVISVHPSLAQFWPIISALLFLALLVAILFRGKPRVPASVVRSDPPIRDLQDPEHQKRRRRAAAAALIFHLRQQNLSSIDENS